MSKATNPADWFALREADQVTEEIVDATVQIVDGWYQASAVDWTDVWDRLDGIELKDGRRLDLGGTSFSPALRELRRRAKQALADD